MFRQRNAKPQYFFLHVPKCAGTAVLQSLSRVGKKRFLILSHSPESKAHAIEAARQGIANRKQQPADVDLLMGHDVFCGLDQISDRPPFYFTFLRDPVARYISHYRYLVDCALNPRHELHEFADAHVMRGETVLSIADYVAIGDNANLMTHYLAAANHPDLATKRWYVQDAEQLVSLAKNCLEKMSLIGTAETSEKDLGLLCEKLGLRPQNPVVNHSKTDIADEIDDRVRNEIAQLNGLDEIVFKHALDLRNRRESSS